MITSEFENKWYLAIRDNILKEFPTEFISNSAIELLELPGKPLMKGSELFGSFEVIDTNGNPIITCDSYDKMKYILYANRNKPLKISIPKVEESLSSTVKEFEKHLDDIIKMIKEDFVKYFPDSDKFVSVSNRIFQLLNLRRF